MKNVGKIHKQAMMKSESMLPKVSSLQSIQRNPKAMRVLPTPLPQDKLQPLTQRETVLEKYERMRVKSEPRMTQEELADIMRRMRKPRWKVNKQKTFYPINKQISSMMQTLSDC